MKFLSLPRNLQPYHAPAAMVGGKDSTRSIPRQARLRSSRLAPVAAILLLLSLAVTACANAGDAEPAGSAPSDAPAIKLLAPQDQASISGDSVGVTVAINGFIMDGTAIGMSAVPGKGHWRLYLNGELANATATDNHLLKPVRPGSHHLRVALANNDHSPLNPPVKVSVVINVAPPAALSQTPLAQLEDDLEY